MGAVPTHTALNDEAYCAKNGTDNDHGMQADEAPLKEVPYREPLFPPAVIGVTNHKTREHKKEIHSQVAVG